MRLLSIYIVCISLLTACIKADDPEPTTPQAVTHDAHMEDGNLVLHGSLVAFAPISIREYGFVFTKTSGTAIDPINLDFTVITNANKVSYGTINQGISFNHIIANPPNSTYRIRTYFVMEGDDTPHFGNLILITP